jgi:hypothetical protein
MAHPQLTHEPNGALDPVRDPRAGVCCSRWWFNPWVSDRTHGLTRGHARALTPTRRERVAGGVGDTGAVRRAHRPWRAARG